MDTNRRAHITKNMEINFQEKHKSASFVKALQTKISRNSELQVAIEEQSVAIEKIRK